ALALTPAGDPPPPPAKPAEAAKAPGPPVDAFGDPLPPGAVARLGSVRFRTAAIPRQLAVSPDGKRIVSIASSPGIRLAVWEADTGRLLREVEPPFSAWPEAVCWPADGRGLTACKVGWKDYVVWEFTDPKAKPPVGDGTAPGPESFTACAFTPDGTLIAGGERAGPRGTAGKLQVWPVHPGRSVREAPPRFTVEEPDGFVALRFTSDGKRLVGITRARKPDQVKPAAPGFPPRAEPGAMADTARVLVWEVATRKKLAAFDVPARGWEFRSIPPPAVPHAVSPDGKTLFTAAWGGRVKAFDLATGKERFDALAFGRLDEPVKESLRQCWSSQVTDLTVTPDGKTVIAAQSTTERTVGLDAATGKERWRRRQDIGFVDAWDSNYGLVVFPDGKRFALGHAAQRIGVYDAATGRQLVEPDANRDGMAVIGIAPDGKSAITAGRDNVLCRWDLGSGRQLGRVEAGDGVQVAALAPDGRRAVGARGLLDPATGKGLASLDLQLETHGAHRAAWLPDGSVVVADLENRAARYAADGKKIATYVVAGPGEPGTGPRVEGVATAPDGKVVVLAGEAATGSEDGWVAVFDAITGTKTRERKGACGFTSAAFLPDGSRVVLGRWLSERSLLANHPNTVQGLMTAVVLFDPATGEQTTPFDAPDPAAEYRIVRSVAVSPTGTQVAAVEYDESLTVYETGSGGIRRRLRGHRGPIAQAAFTPDGSRLVTVSDDGTGLVWDVTPPRPAGPVALADGDRQKRWATLLSADAEAAHRAMGELAADPAGTVAFLKEHLKSTPAPTDADLDRLLTGLGATAFADREAAARDLDALGSLAVAKVRAKLAAVTSAEVRQRLEEFLKRHDRPGRTTGARLREIRAVELLEVTGTPEARAVLTELSRGESPLAKDAGAAGKR
ncbi:MAG: WD40 repeat domain-containing protein, partial [Zavarzinella sp.]|nr:WD40 repeat domain-containing protein [Zavarzinella sp.]